MLDRVKEFLPRLQQANLNLPASPDHLSLVEIEPLTEDNRSSSDDIVSRDFSESGAVLEIEEHTQQQPKEFGAPLAVVYMDLYLGVLDVQPSSSLLNETESSLESKGIKLINRELDDEQRVEKGVIERVLGVSLSHCSHHDSTTANSLIQELSSEMSSDSEDEETTEV